MTFAGVVVTYNRKNELIKNIKSILSQSKSFDNFYIIDNHSTDGTFDFLIDNEIPINEVVGDVQGKERIIHNEKSIPNIVFVELSDNIGGAGGFNAGMEKAYNDGNDFIVLMDDDGRPVRNDCFEKLYEEAEIFYKENKKLMINSLVVGTEEDTIEQGVNSTQILSFGLGTSSTVGNAWSVAEKGIINDFINPFNGTLVTKELLAEIGFVNKDFFIRGDEVDFQSRAIKSGTKISTVMNSVYFHPACELFPMKWRGRTVYIGTAAPWKTYYLVRNYSYRIKRDRGVINAYKFLIFHLYSTFKVDKNWKNCLHMIFKGFKDGMKGRLGKLVQPGEK